MEIKNISTNTVSQLQELKGAELFVYSIIGGSKDNCVSMGTLAEMLKISTPAVCKIVKKLVNKGYIEQVNWGVQGIKGATYKLLKEDPFNFDWRIFMNLEEEERLTRVLGRYFEMRVGKDKYGNGRFRCYELDEAQEKLAQLGLIEIYEGDGQYHILFIKEKKYMFENENYKKVNIEVKDKVDYKKLYEEKCAEAEELRDKGRKLKEFAMGREKDLKDRIAELEAELESLRN